MTKIVLSLNVAGEVRCESRHLAAGEGMSELKDFILRKKREYEAVAGPLLERQDWLKSELRSVEQEIQRLIPQLEEIDRAAQAIGIELELETARPAQEKKSNITIKQAIRRALYQCDGMSSSDLLETINEIYFGNSLDRTSFSPQLSRMRSNKEVEADGNVWRLTRHGANIMNHTEARASVAEHKAELSRSQKSDALETSNSDFFES